MKLFFILIFLISFSAFAQLHTGVTSSIQVNSLAGDDVPVNDEQGAPLYTSKVGVDIGVAAHYDVNTYLRFTSGLNYKSKGFAIVLTGVEGEETDYQHSSKFKNRYISLPIYVQGNIGAEDDFVFINAGVEFDYLVSTETKTFTKTDDAIHDTPYTSRSSEGMTEFDVALGFNVGYQFGVSVVDLFISSGYQLGLLPTLKDEKGVQPGDLHYQSIRLNVGVLFTV